MIRLITEDTGDLNAILSQHVDGYTMFDAQGMWKGTTENTKIIDIEGIDRMTAQAIAADICETNNQEAVLIQQLERNSEFYTPKGN